MFASKALTAQNDKVGPIVLPKDRKIRASVQYGAGGQGTIVLQGTVDGTTFIDIGLTPASYGAVVANLAASGIGFADVSGFRSVQINKSVAGAGAVTATLGIQSGL